MLLSGLAQDPLKGCGGKIWAEASSLLCDYLNQLGPQYLRGKRVLELGAGTGVVGIYAFHSCSLVNSVDISTVNLYRDYRENNTKDNTKINNDDHDHDDDYDDENAEKYYHLAEVDGVECAGESKMIKISHDQTAAASPNSAIYSCYDGMKELVLTDYGAMCDLLRSNVQRVLGSHPLRGRVRVEQLFWGDGEDCERVLRDNNNNGVADGIGSSDEANQTPRFDLILMSECVYLEQYFEPLLKTLELLVRPGTVCLMSYTRRRRAEKRFFMRLRKHFDCRLVTSEDRNHVAYSSRKLYLFEITIKKGK